MKQLNGNGNGNHRDTETRRTNSFLCASVSLWFFRFGDP
jgi:hypothetical protein